jgi:hypothetical protein
MVVTMQNSSASLTEACSSETLPNSHLTRGLNIPEDRHVTSTLFFSKA